MFKCVQGTLTELLENKKLFIFSYALSVVFYSFLIVNQLTNTYDGMWHSNISLAGGSEIAVGRWALPYFDVLHLGLQIEPFVSLFTLLFISLLTMMIVDMFEIKGILAYFVSVYITTSSIVTCILSYRYTAISYGICAMLAVAAVWFLTKKDIGYIRYVLSIVCLVVSLGLYQADIAVTAVLISFQAIYMLSEDRQIRDVFKFILESALIIVISCIIYRLISVFHMTILGITALDYNGANSISLTGILKALPQSIINCYKSFYGYFFSNNDVYYNIFQQFKIFSILFIGFSFYILLGKMFKTLNEKRYLNTFIIILLILLLPVCSSFSLLLARKASLMIQMTFSFALIFPCLFGIIDVSGGGNRGICWIKKGVLLSLIFFFTIGNSLQSNLDMITMYEGRESTRGIVNRITDTLIQNDMLTKDKQYVFLGNPSDNALLYTTSDLEARNKNDIYAKYGAKNNSYAKYGEFWTTADCMNMSYAGVLRDIGVNIPLCTDAAYDVIQNLEEVKNMPAFPAEGSISEVNEYIVVKVAEY